MSKEVIISVDIGASKILAQIVDKQGDLGSENLVELVAINPNNNELENLLISAIKPLIDAEKNNKIVAISIGAPGSVDSVKGIIKGMANIKNVGNLSMSQLAKKFNLPIYLLNDADAAGLGELWLGAGKGFKNMVYLTLSTGVGSSIIKNTELKPGSELGHHSPLITSDEQRLCSCGDYNCPESFLGTKGLAKIYAEIFGIELSNLDTAEIHSISPKMREGVSRGNKKWAAVEQKYVEYLGLFLDNIISKYDPEAIVLGGGIIFGNNSLLKSLESHPRVTEQTKILPAKLGNSVNLGAAKYGFDKLG